MLKKLKVHNFKTFLNSEFTFGPRHLLIGKNNSGKTNLVRLLQFLGLTATNELDQAATWLPGGIQEICNWSLKSDQIDIALDCTWEYEGLPHSYRYELGLERYSPGRALAGKQAGLRLVNERLVLSLESKNLILLENNGIEALILREETNPQEHDRAQAPNNATMLSKVYEAESNRRTILFRNYLRNWRYFSLSPLAMRTGPVEAWRGGQAPQAGFPFHGWWTACDPFGFELSNSIFQLKVLDDRRFRQLLKHVRLVEPALEAINHIPAPGQQPVPFVALSNQQNASWNGLSDGTLRAIPMALIIETSAACSPPTNAMPCLTLIEEPENGIYPGLLRRFFDLFEDWAPSSQFIFTSHSPYFIDMFDDKRQWVTILKKATDRSESFSPPNIEPEKNGAERLTLASEYASELFHDTADRSRVPGSH